MKNNIAKKSIGEFVTGIILLVLLLLVLNPFRLWMANMTVDLILVLLLCSFGLFAAYLLQEKVADEREERHRLLSGRIAFLSGSAVLVVGIIANELAGKSDPWLFLALVVMVIAKMATRIYTDRTH